MPGFSVRRSVWAAALARVPDMLPESFVGSPKESLQGLGFDPAFADQPEGPEGQEALMALAAKFKTGAPGWAKGTNDLRGVNVLDRLNFNNPSYITGLLATLARESKALESVLDHLAPLPGQKHLVVFSRCEADDMSHPSVKRAMHQRFQRERGDAGGPAESATLSTRDMMLLQASLRTKATEAGVTLFSVAGAGQNVFGHVGAATSATGGFAFPLNVGVETTFGQNIQMFGSRYFVAWQEDAPPQKPASLEITTTRKDVKLILQTNR
jgi:hypothetical protein